MLLEVPINMNIRVELTVGLGEAQVEVMRTAYKRPSRTWETLIMSAESTDASSSPNITLRTSPNVEADQINLNATL